MIGGPAATRWQGVATAAAPVRRALNTGFQTSSQASVMVYSGPIKLGQLFDPQPVWERGECPYSFLAFPVSAVSQDGVPGDVAAQEYIAAVQAEGVPVGIWLRTPTEGTGYAVVMQADIPLLKRALDALEKSNRFPKRFATEVTERLFTENSSA